MTLPETTPSSINRRILIVDDNPAIHNDFRAILAGPPSGDAEIDADAAALFGPGRPAEIATDFEIASAHQGEEALEMVLHAHQIGRPYAMVFVDMRMPPGWDGLTTISRLWEVDNAIQTVICTAYSDRRWSEIQSTLTRPDGWLVLKKPFDKIEVLQLAHALTEKWSLARLAGFKMTLLEGMVEARTADLEKAHRVTSEFLANANHELLTPMNGICGLLELLADTPLNREQRVDLQQAQSCAHDLLRLLTQILEFNRAEAGLLAPEAGTFSLWDLLQTVAREHAAAVSAKRLRFQTQIDDEVGARWRGPETLIRKTLALLIDNAIKFTPTGTVTVRCQPSTDGLEFCVGDTGIGMTSQQLEWIQIPFAQVDGGMSRSSSGMGLGLPLANQMVRLMGGVLRLEATPDHGVAARFTIKAVAVSNVAA
jgi:signal transduction histidine kinase